MKIKPADNSHLEILRMARELVINEHRDRRARDHNRWLAESEVLWKSKRQKLPYPAIPAYPTEQEILARAQILLDFVNQGQSLEQMVNQANPDSPPPKAEPKQDALLVDSAKVSEGKPDIGRSPSQTSTEDTTNENNDRAVPVADHSRNNDAGPNRDELTVQPVPQAAQEPQAESKADSTAEPQQATEQTEKPAKPTIKDLEKLNDQLIGMYTRKMAEDAIEEESTPTGRILPAVLKKIEELKNNWRQ